MQNTVQSLGCYTGPGELRSRRPRGEVDRSVPDLAADTAIDAGEATRELKGAEKRTPPDVGPAVRADVGSRDGVGVGVAAGRCWTGADVAGGMEAGPVADDVDDAVRKVTESVTVNLSNVRADQTCKSPRRVGVGGGCRS